MSDQFANNVAEVVAVIGDDIGDIRKRQIDQAKALIDLQNRIAPTAAKITQTATNQVVIGSNKNELLFGMCSKTGQQISGIYYLRQRVIDCLTTRVGTQVLCRERGCELAELMDAPMSSLLLIKVSSAILSAIRSPVSGVPDFKISKISYSGTGIPGELGLRIKGRWLGSNQEISI